MPSNLKLVINNPHKQIEEKQFFEKEELKIILDLYAKMVSEGSWKDYGLSISTKQVSFSVFRNAAENALYKICKNFKPNNKNLKSLLHQSKSNNILTCSILSITPKLTLFCLYKKLKIKVNISVVCILHTINFHKPFGLTHAIFIVLTFADLYSIFFRQEEKYSVRI